MTNIEAALKYAEKGWSIFPCKVDKTPLTENGFKGATKDPEQIKRWWTEHPDASIGLPCGPVNGVWVLDIDMPDGPRVLQSLQEKHGRLPDTLMQKTGGNGTQYFFNWNGTDIHNSANKIGRNIDVRGNGGYVILPPSSHPSSNKYRWLTKHSITAPPAWLVDLSMKKEEKRDPAPATYGTTKYGQSALLDEIRILRSASDGNRNDQLNRSAFALGQLVAGGELDEFEAEAMLTTAGKALGLDTREIPATIKSGMGSGQKYQRTAPEKDKYYFDPKEGESVSTVSTVSEVGGSKQVVSTGAKLVSSGKQDQQENIRDKSINLACQIKEWIINSTGSFTVEQLDREFCLTTREEKNNRAKCLSIYKEKKIIKRDKRIKGKWHVIDSDVTWVDLNCADDEPFKIILPFGLHEKIAIPRKSIIVMAGTTNAGKTAVMMNTLRLNINQEYEKIYLMSEMGDGEYKNRVKQFGDSLDLWNRNIKAAAKSHDFDGMIQNYNPDGLTCIDYLEEIDGEYFKIASSIRDIYDSLSDGVAFIAIQKKSMSEFGRGGEATAEKARLYMTIDFLCSLEHAIVCSLKIIKAKQSIKENMVGRELHFKIEKGSCLTPLTDWVPSNKINRAMCILKYEKEDGITREYIPFTFNTVEGEEVTLNREHHESWQLAFPRMDVDRELRRVSDMSRAAPWLIKTKGKWFYQLGSHIEKRAKEKR